MGCGRRETERSLRDHQFLGRAGEAQDGIPEHSGLEKDQPGIRHGEVVLTASAVREAMVLAQGALE